MMKSVSQTKTGRRFIGQLSSITSRWGLLAALVVHALGYAGNDKAPQWNIMVVPANETVFSGEARTIFNKHCASCHSEDGRAQTPVAQQRHVQDLSECTLSDDQIIEQILEGTHNKANTFKMPAFREKLNRAKIESLVPLVKAFRPIPEEPQHNPVRPPRLAGMLNGSLGRFAIFETENGSGHYFILRQQESHRGVKLVKFIPRKGSVKLELAGTNKPVNLSLSNWAASHPKQRGVFGFLDLLGQSLNEASSYLVLDRVNTDLILFLYAQATGRTPLRAPGLPEATFNLDLHNSSHIYISRKLRQALNDNGIVAVKYGEKFLLIVPQAEVSNVTLPSPDTDPTVLTNDLPERFPGGVIINFRKASLRQILKLYSSVTGRTFSPNPNVRRADIAIDFTTQSPLSREECAHALETLLRLHGLDITLHGSDAFTVTQSSTQEPH